MRPSNNVALPSHLESAAQHRRLRGRYDRRPIHAEAVGIVMPKNQNEIISILSKALKIIFQPETPPAASAREPREKVPLIFARHDEASAALARYDEKIICIQQSNRLVRSVTSGVR